MKEKELRLAIVFFGGVSLAVYQHGINRKILNLIRASKLYHRSRQDQDSAVPSNIPSFCSRYPEEPERSTGDVYLQCLETIGQHLSLRVIVDVISGASAGGMNGIALARALAHDFSLARELVRHRLRCAGDCQVGRQDLHDSAVILADGFRHFIECIGVACDQDDFVDGFLGKLDRDRAADAARSAGDECRFSGELQIHSFILSMGRLSRKECIPDGRLASQSVAFSLDIMDKFYVKKNFLPA